jgi:hypothetical protein
MLCFTPLYAVVFPFSWLFWTPNSNSLIPLAESESKSYVTTDSQSASLSWNKAPIWGLRPDVLLLSDSCRFVDVGCSLWREDGSVVYNCCWFLPAQSFLGPSPVGLMTIFCRLRFETSLFVASYDSQGYSGGVRPCLHMGLIPLATSKLSLHRLRSDPIENMCHMSECVARTT